MTPKQYAEKYWNLEVPFADGSVTVRVDRYLSGCHSSDLLRKAQTLVEKKDAPLTVRVRTIHGGLDTRTYDWITRKKLTGVLQDPFTGKGSPEEVQVLLQVAGSTDHGDEGERAELPFEGRLPSAKLPLGDGFLLPFAAFLQMPPRCRTWSFERFCSRPCALNLLVW